MRSSIAAAALPLLVALGLALAAPASAKTPAPRREIVIASEALVISGDRLPGQLDAFLRRIENLTGWPQGSLGGRVFARPAEALVYIRKAKPKPAFAILPVHQFVQGRKELGLSVLARVIGLEGAEPTFWVVAPKEKAKFEHIEFAPGLRLTTTEIDDMRWLSNVVFETNVQAEKHFKLLRAENAGAALAAVDTGQADVALIYEAEYRRHPERIHKEGALVPVYASGVLPPPPLVAIGKSATATDQKALVSVFSKLCDGLPDVSVHAACAHLGIMYIKPSARDPYDNVIEKYDGAPPSSAKR